MFVTKQSFLGFFFLFFFISGVCPSSFATVLTVILNSEVSATD